MADLIVNRGLQMIADRASGVAGAGAVIQTMSVDDRATAFAAGDTTLGTPTNEADVAIAAPTRSGQTVTHVGTFDTSVALTIRRVALHNDTSANVSGTSTSLVAGVDGQSFVKTVDFSLVLTMKMTYTSI